MLSKKLCRMCNATDAYRETISGAPCSWLVYDLCVACAVEHGRPVTVVSFFNDSSGQPQSMSFETTLIPGHETTDLPEICIRLLNDKHWRDFKMTAIQYMYETLDNEDFKITVLFP